MLTLPLDHIRFQPSAMAGMGGGRTGRVKLPERETWRFSVVRVASEEKKS